MNKIMLEQVTQQGKLLDASPLLNVKQGITSDTLDRAVPIIAVLAAVVLWLMSTTQIDINAMNDYGLVSVLPLSAYLALLLITFSFCTTLAQQRFDKLTLAIHFLAVIFMLYGLTSLIEPTPRFHVAWRHIGISEYISRTHNIDPWINAYFNWPGFFILTTFLIDAAGITNAIELTRWAPLFQNILYFGPLYLLFTAGTADKRLVWLAMWLFYITNWVSQDYFAPQALNYFLYLVMLGILLQWFRGQRLDVAYIPAQWLEVQPMRACLKWLNGRFTTDNPIHAYAFARQRIGLLIIVVLIFAAIVPSHQLTPIFAIGSVGLLVLFNRCTVRELPVLMVVLTVTWIMFMAIVYLSGHVDKVFGSFGAVDKNVTVSLFARIKGSPEHVIVVFARLFMTVAIGIFAVLGVLRRLVNGTVDLSYGLLVLAPFLFVIVQPYGGEMIIRAYFFALPAMCFMAATLFYPTAAGRGWGTACAVGLVTLLLGSGFMLARYGNERMDYYTVREVAAVNTMYELAEPGSLLIVSSDNVPWKHKELEQYKYKIATPATRRADVARFVELMTNPKHTNAYYLYTRSQKAYSELFLGDPPGEWTRTVQTLLDSGHFVIAYENLDAVILTLRNRAALMNEASN